jgi:hypothetical protein
LQICPSKFVLPSLRSRDRRRAATDEGTHLLHMQLAQMPRAIAPELLQHDAERVTSRSEHRATARREAEHHGDRGEDKTADDGAQ